MVIQNDFLQQFHLYYYYTITLISLEPVNNIMKSRIVGLSALCFLFNSVVSFTVVPKCATLSQSTSHQTYNIIQLHNTEDDQENDSSLRIGIDKAWRYVPKPLLRIGGKGVADSHGNSLKELLNAHTIVKVKINSDKIGSLEDVFESLKDLVGKKGGMIGVELLHVRKSENTLLIGVEGTMDKIRGGLFPPSD